MVDDLDPTTKHVSLKGIAAEDYYKSKGLRRRRGGTRKQKGGDAPPGPEIKGRLNITKLSGGGSELPVQQTLPGTNPQQAAARTELPAVDAALKAGTAPTPPNAPLVPAPGNQTGGKVILEPKKHAKGKVLLAPPTHLKKSGTRLAAAKYPSGTRKVKLTLNNMKKRMTTQKVIHKDSKEKSIEEIRKLLEDAKLVKPARDGKKVPEDILRNIYKDYLILRNKAL